MSPLISRRDRARPVPVGGRAPAIIPTTVRLPTLPGVIATVTSAAAFVAALTVVAPAAGAQQTEEQRRQDEMARRMLEAAQPGPQHQLLASLGGDWNVRVSHVAEPGGAPTVGTGTATNRMILGGRFLQSELTVQLGERADEALVLLGYDRRWNRYTMVSLDTRGTHYVEAEGPFDEGSRAIILYGVESDPMTRRSEDFTVVLRFVSPDEYVQQVVFRLPDGRSYPAVEIRFTRAR